MTVRSLYGTLGTPLLTCSLVLLAPSLAMGQEDISFVQPTAKQVELNDQAVRAIAADDAVKAVSLLEESNYIGSLNITYLNLGRAYQRLDQCPQARSAYENALSAPKVEQPPPGLVAQKAKQFLAELDEQCATAEAAPAHDDDSAGVAPPPSEAPTSSQAVWGWSAVAGGAVLAAGGVGLHLWAESLRDEVRDPVVNDDEQITSISQAQAVEQESQANTLSTAGVSLIGVGIIGATVGTYLLVTDSNVEDASALSVGLRRDGVMCSWKAQF